MQTIYLDIAEKNALRHIYAKQGDMGSEIQAMLLNNAEADSTEHSTGITICATWA